MGKTISNLRHRFLLMLCLAFVTCSSVLAQSGVSIRFKDAPLKEVLESVSKQSNYKFVYTDELKIDGYKVTVESNNDSAENLFNKIFKSANISYAVKGNQVVLGVIKVAPQVVQAPTRPVKITGVVLEQENGESLPGVTVQNVTRNNMVSSDLDGKYSIDAAPGDKLLFSSIGMANYEVVIGKAAVVNVEMKADAIALSDVVVTGYQTLSKERATGSYNVIKAEQLEKPSSNIASRLIGTSAGVQTKTDADGNVSFEIRGQTSLTATAQPLVVVDGFPIQGSFSTINPNEVENITILKDAAAASIWGAKSANGVIVVTTKSGRTGRAAGDRQVKVELSSFWKISPKMEYDYINPYASSAEIIDYEQKGFDTNFFGGPWAPKEDGSSQSHLVGSHSLAVLAMNENRLGRLSDADLQVTLANLRNTDNRQAIKDYILDNPFTQQYNVNISNATDRMSNMLSLMYEGNTGSYQGYNKKRYNIGYRTKVNVFKWLDFSFAGNFNMDDTKDNTYSYAGSPYETFVNEDGSRVRMDGSYYMPNMKKYVPMDKFPYKDWTFNPLDERDAKNYRTTRYNIRAQGGLTVKIIKGLTVDSKIQYEQEKVSTRNILDESSISVRSTINQASSWDKKTNEITRNLPLGSWLDQTKGDIDSYNWRNQLNFNRGFNNDKHQVSFIAGTEIYDITVQSTTSPRTYGYNDDKLTVGTFPNGVGGSGAYRINNWMGSSQTFAYTHSYKYSTERYFSLFANASYTFDSKYTVSGSYRTDASNLITDDPKYRYSPFWSVGASWNMTSEDFIKNTTWLDRLIVRATFGYNGNVDRSTSFLPLISIGGTQNSYINDYTASISSYGNPALRWEKTGTFDLGVDYSMLKGKLYGKIDFYNKKSKDLIVSMSIPSVNGTNTQKLNAAEMTNRGFELELGSSLRILGNDITWTGGITFAYNYNNIDNLFKTKYNASDLYGGGTAAYVQGYNANALWAFQYAGIRNYGTEKNPNWQPVVQGSGDEVYDFNAWTPGDGRDYMLNMGTKVAPYTASLTSSFKIYDFNLSFIFTGKFGHVFNGMTFNYPSMSGGSALPNNLYSEVLNADPSQRVPIPFGKAEPKYYFWDRFYPYLDYRVQNANHIRCQEVNITYNLPKSISKKVGISNARFYAQGNNLFVIHNNKYNEDPEFPSGTRRPRAAFTFGLNLTF